MIAYSTVAYSPVGLSASQVADRGQPLGNRRLQLGSCGRVGAQPHRLAVDVEADYARRQQGGRYFMSARRHQRRLK
jgi:hypothetical protein